MTAPGRTAGATFPAAPEPRALAAHELDRIADAAWLDVRPEAAFTAGHRPGSGNVPIEEWDARRAELPPRPTRVVMLDADPERAREAARRLAASGYEAAYLDAAWKPGTDGVERGRGARLWQPAPFLAHVLEGLPRGRALDVACGAGREAVYLGLSGFAVEAWDRDAGALARAEALGRRWEAPIATTVVDLEAPDLELPEATFALVACFRFLHRPLLPRLAAAVAPGGHLVYETFLEGQERFGHPRRPRFLLAPGELSRSFPALRIRHYEERRPEGGPWTARLLAQRA